MLLEDVWGTDFPGETRTVDVHVGEVRRKLGPDGPPIETVRGVGYRLVPPGREPVPAVRQPRRPAAGRLSRCPPASPAGSSARSRSSRSPCGSRSGRRCSSSCAASTPMRRPARLADIAQTFAVRIRAAAVDREVRQVVNQIRNEVAGSGVTIQLLASDGTTVEIGATDPEPVEPIVIPATTKIGDTLTGLAPFTDGDQHDYAALVLRGPNAAVYRAVLLSTVDTSGAAALRDVTRTLPIVILATLLVGAPMAVLLSRSVARPLDRLAAAPRGARRSAAGPRRAPPGDRPARGPRPDRSGERARASSSPGPAPARASCSPTCATTCGRR